MIDDIRRAVEETVLDELRRRVTHCVKLTRGGHRRQAADRLLGLASGSTLLAAANSTMTASQVLCQIDLTMKKKRADYALDGSPWSNFEGSSKTLAIEGFGPVQAALFNAAQKVERLVSLHANGRMADPENESAADTYLDLAAYTIIAYLMYCEQMPGGVV